ncbi:hypothetical protein GXW83_04325 [Streptacidiphilus sp. PB12-B1b]|uniref:hypothetical protein n=1 Tax=Streptacidiphilus sp. PB12-B1b TaxID=2705012 RepID=UPI0015FBB5E3|nr:hypothetical protein [Streptacidiphilus sp. PB12-B1b]QMU75098.1 hypothetical protein GXW83_04325 [Streptacidiphilus sp. PB12-B1b]
MNAKLKGAVRLALRVYPAHYRSMHGDELAATATDAAQGGGRWATLSEAGALAAHGLRLRLRIGPDRPLGQILAWAAPLAVAVDAAVRLANVVTILRMLHPLLSWNLLQRQFALEPTIAGATLSLLALLALSFGLRQTARLLAVAACATAAVAAVLTEHYATSHGDGPMWAATLLPLASPALSTLLLLAAPLGLTPADGPKRAAAVPAAFILAGAIGVLLDQHSWQILVSGLALSLALLSTERLRRPAAVAALALAPAALYPLLRVVQGDILYEAQLRGVLILAALFAIAGKVVTPRLRAAEEAAEPDDPEPLYAVTRE